MPARQLLVCASVVCFLFPGLGHALPLVGTSSGVFVNPIGPSGMVVTGVGTNLFGWGVGSPPNSLGFAGLAFATDTETVFSFGTLTYYNGSISAGTEANAVDLAVTLSLTTPAGITTPFAFNLQILNTPNTGDPIASADIVNFPSFFPSTVFDYDGVAHTLEIVGFGAVSGSGYTTSSSFNVLEGSTASTQLLGRVTSDVSNVVPEPGSLGLMGLGIASLVAVRLRKKSRP